MWLCIASPSSFYLLHHPFYLATSLRRPPALCRTVRRIPGRSLGLAQAKERQVEARRTRSHQLRQRLAQPRAELDTETTHHQTHAINGNTPSADCHQQSRCTACEHSECMDIEHCQQSAQTHNCFTCAPFFHARTHRFIHSSAHSCIHSFIHSCAFIRSLVYRTWKLTLKPWPEQGDATSTWRCCGWKSTRLQVNTRQDDTR